MPTHLPTYLPTCTYLLQIPKVGMRFSVVSSPSQLHTQMSLMTKIPPRRMITVSLQFTRLNPAAA